ncbi:hypothetical protein EB796_003605 [Bugula neritina]|uniref:Uncharacterized protein n=1 Tax=Bugula neritina TaxID=10212 RepID=A0A7J7KHD9_BUGNE|nr:hypothetical protein EB796_003605 [Bugula neritina]
MYNQVTLDSTHAHTQCRSNSMTTTFILSTMPCLMMSRFLQLTSCCKHLTSCCKYLTSCCKYLTSCCKYLTSCCKYLTS